MKVPEFEFPVIEKTFKSIGTRDVKLYIFESSEAKKKQAAILFFIGGSFAKNPQSPAVFQQQANYFASLGMVAICVDYRARHDAGFTPKQAIADAKSSVRWVRQHADELGVDSEKIVMCGASAGGYVCVSSIMFDHVDDDPVYHQRNCNHIPNALIIFGAGMDGVDIMQRRYPEILDQAIEISPFHNIKRLYHQLYGCVVQRRIPHRFLTVFMCKINYLSSAWWSLEMKSISKNMKEWNMVSLDTGDIITNIFTKRMRGWQLF
ncbi:hypothetical protein J14TS2_31740 [Bacillus sp. J14TS2]|uniref:alpha/beta hydrolase n=1 Tax=Bacillus sp. J14TS2 TaxID=2807188 RepID=UPI001B06E5FD|nr:alpha/beta hydrolase [Bacillus sp. J14TS2]GIN72699.1 hypothetical protein J14TS2_31740 [Bacillus sp. J14TS2]